MIATAVAPVVAQFNILLPPALMLAGLAAKALIRGRFSACTATFTVVFTEPAELVAVSVYVVVTVGLTALEPLADTDVNVPGVIATVVAPVVAQFNVLLPPALMLAGLAVKALIRGRFSACTATLTVVFTEPAELVAVSVYVVVAVGLMVLDPLADADVNVPGVIATVVAPVVAQLNVLVPPTLMLVELAVKELIKGNAACTATVTAAFTEPAALVAVSVYVVVAVGLTALEPLADADVKVPGVIVIAVAPVVIQLNVLVPPTLMLAELAVKDLIRGKFAACTATVTVAFTEPAALVAVSV